MKENSPNDISQVAMTAFVNRDISPNALSKYQTINRNFLYDYSLLEHMEDAVQCVLRHIKCNSHIHILVDCDPDGYTSAACLYLYLMKISPTCRLSYSLHTGKEHGLSSDVHIPSDIELLIVPDAGSNDVEQCAALQAKGVEIVILDHHIMEVENPYAIVVNSQCASYPNKELSGVGVVYKFLQAMDDETWNSVADQHLDLVALGMIADSMDVRSDETRTLIQLGLAKIRNSILHTMIESQSYFIANGITIHDIQFSIIPLLNSLIRMGTLEEKDIMFRALIQDNELFEFKYRGEIRRENIYNRALRICKATKKRQKVEVDRSVCEIVAHIDQWNLDANSVIFANVSHSLAEPLTGLMAARIAERYHKPCLLLRERGNNRFGGSARNYPNSKVADLQEVISQTGLFEYAQGHPHAFGFEIRRDNIDAAIAKINAMLSDVEFTSFIEADFIIDSVDLTVGLIRDITNLKPFYGKGFDEVTVVVEDQTVFIESFSLRGKNRNYWVITTAEGIEIIKYNIGRNDPLAAIISAKGQASITFSGRAHIYLNGICRMIVSDYMISEG